jgi:hypothetical protein
MEVTDSYCRSISFFIWWMLSYLLPFLDGFTQHYDNTLMADVVDGNTQHGDHN